MNWKKLFGIRCRHKKLISYQTLSGGDMTEPGKESRKVLLRLLWFDCSECKQTVRMFPRGVAHDPEKNIFRDKNEPNRTEDIEVPDEVRKEVLEYQY